jgi:hypothetical protein
VDEPAEAARPNVPVPALPAGLGLIAVVNSDAGGDTPAEAELRTLLPMTDIRLCESGVDLHLVLDRAACCGAAQHGPQAARTSLTPAS